MGEDRTPGWGDDRQTNFETRIYPSLLFGMSFPQIRNFLCDMQLRQDHTCRLETLDISRCTEVKTPQVQEDKKQRHEGDEDEGDE